MSRAQWSVLTLCIFAVIVWLGLAPLETAPNPAVGAAPAQETATPDPATPTPEYLLYAPMVLDRPSQPASPVLSITPLGSTQYELSWTYSGAEEIFVLSEATTPAFTTPTRTSFRSVRSTTLTKTGSGTWYYYIQVCNGLGCSAPSNVQLITRIPTATPTPVPPPSLFYSVGDAGVVAANASSNYGTATDMRVGYDHCAFDSVMRSFVQFDLSSIPRNYPIQRAVLSVHLASSCDLGERRHVLQAFRALSSWSEGSITWNNQPATGPLQAQVEVISRNNFRRYEMDISALVLGWVNGSTTNNGLVLRMNESSGNDGARLGFYTRDTNDVELAPYIRVTYPGLAATNDTDGLTNGAGASAVSMSESLPPDQAKPSEGYREVTAAR